MNTISDDKAVETMEAQVDAPDDDLPITVPLPGLPPKVATTTPAEVVAVRRSTTQPTQAAHELVLTPAVRVPVRMLSTAVLAATTTTAARMLVSPSRNVITQPMPHLPHGAAPRLRVVRGVRVNVEFPIYDGANYLGRRDDEPIDIDLEEQEPADRVWASRKHAVIYFHDGLLEIEDLNSLNGTFVNRNRVAPGQRHVLRVNDVIQVGTIQMRLMA